MYTNYLILILLFFRKQEGNPLLSSFYKFYLYKRKIQTKSKKRKTEGRYKQKLKRGKPVSKKRFLPRLTPKYNKS